MLLPLSRPPCHQPLLNGNMSQAMPVPTGDPYAALI